MVRVLQFSTDFESFPDIILVKVINENLAEKQLQVAAFFGPSNQLILRLGHINSIVDQHGLYFAGPKRGGKKRGRRDI